MTVALMLKLQQKLSMRCVCVVGGGAGRGGEGAGVTLIKQHFYLFIYFLFPRCCSVSSHPAAAHVAVHARGQCRTSLEETHKKKKKEKKILPAQRP